MQARKPLKGPGMAREGQCRGPFVGPSASEG